jgi:hypothetical protein
MTHITQFTFDKAQYKVQDSEGNSVTLIMNYAGNSYEVEGIENELVRQIALDLLAKKHAANFAHKFESYEVE